MYVPSTCTGVVNPISVSFCQVLVKIFLLHLLHFMDLSPFQQKIKVYPEYTIRNQPWEKKSIYFYAPAGTFLSVTPSSRETFFIPTCGDG